MSRQPITPEEVENHRCFDASFDPDEDVSRCQSCGCLTTTGEPTTTIAVCGRYPDGAEWTEQGATLCSTCAERLRRWLYVDKELEEFEAILRAAYELWCEEKTRLVSKGVVVCSFREWKLLVAARAKGKS